jgi:hypothetical protein
VENKFVAGNHLRPRSEQDIKILLAHLMEIKAKRKSKVELLKLFLNVRDDEINWKFLTDFKIEHHDRKKNIIRQAFGQIATRRRLKK